MMRISKSWLLIQKKALPFSVGLLLLCVPIHPIFGFQGNTQVPIKLGPRNKVDAWVKHEVNGITYEVALEWLMGKENGWGSKRVIFVFIEPELFTRGNILAVFQDISSKIPQPTFLNVTLLSDREMLKGRVQKYIGLVISHDNIYARLTGDNAQWCPQGFMGAQFERYKDSENYVLCTEENLEEIVKEDGATPRSRVIDRRVRRF